MLEYQKDGKKVECKAIYNWGHIKQIVILDHVGFGESSTGSLARYPLCSVFTIETAALVLGEMRYNLRDTDGNHVEFVTGSYLYDLNEWIAWQVGHNEEKLRRKDHKIELQSAQIDVLKSAIAGIRVITEDQLKTLVGK